MSEELLSRGLPKWPQCLVTGRSVTVDQAKEIIRRTDAFWFGHSGNAHEWNKWVWSQFGFETQQYIDCPEFAQVDGFCKRMDIVGTEYIHNTWISSSYVGGPYGWCHPNGRIMYTANIGKYPSAREVFDEWQKLASAFPFIELGCVLMDCEECSVNETSSRVVGYRVSHGKVEVVDPLVTDPLAGFDPPSSLGDIVSKALACVTLAPILREVGIPKEWIIEWAKAYKDGLRETDG